VSAVSSRTADLAPSVGRYGPLYRNLVPREV
jgi:hypothetical protein